jgi:curved DNA-binding protein CbpA
MKLDSKYFDMIRIRPEGASSKRARTKETVFGPCNWKGCEAPGNHRAPMGRGRDGEYFMFCREHVRQYNSTYNYFDGMSDGEIEQFRNDAIYGHRPTWKVGSNSSSQGPGHGPANSKTGYGAGASGAHPGAQQFHAWRARQAREAVKTAQRQLKPLEKKALKALHITGTPSRDEIKARFKELVKRHHPDSNGGDRGAEEKLREIIQAYNYLKQAGLV